MLEPAGRGQCVHEADQLIDILNLGKFQTQLLREDDRKIKSDTMVWRVRDEMIGKAIEGVGENPDEGHSDKHLELDRELYEKLR
jgi:hypothetical protein